MGSDQTETPAGAAEQAEQAQRGPKIEVLEPSSTKQAGAGSFDVVALDIVLLIAACFAVLARLYAQPSNSLMPVAVLSATGCGLLITALRKLRTSQGPGLLEAGIAGLSMALFQFIAALTYPTVITTLGTDTGQRVGFLTTWALVAAFSIIFAIAGAVLGHLAFAPLRPLPTKRGASSPAASPPKHALPQNSFVNYLIIVLLLGLAPTLAGFVFSAAFDYMLSFYQLTPGPFPSLRLLSTLLPWQVPLQIDFSGNNASSIILLLWRIPFFLGNPTLFDLQALEPFVFNGAALSLLLLTIHGSDINQTGQTPPLRWPIYLALTVALGLFLVLPANLEMLGGLQGALQIPQFGIVIPIRTLHILDQVTFALNLVTGPLLCLGIGVLMRRLYRR